MTDIEAIEWLKHIRDKYIHGGDAWFDEQRCRAIEYAIECIYKRNKWIPVSERLPEKRGFVLVFSTDKIVGEAIYDRDNLFYWAGSSEYDMDISVTHWMPLPEPPKEKGLVK